MELKKRKDGKPYVIIRGDRSGVFAGFLISKNKREVVLENSRRLWYWDGAASLSQLAMEGVSKPQNCKFTIAVNEQIVLDTIEIIPCSIVAFNCIEKVQIWKA